MRLAFDIEGDNLLKAVTKIHCVCAEDIDTGEHWQFRPQQIQEALELLSQASVLYAHNLFGYDVPALHKLYGWVPAKDTELRDTLVWSTLCFADLSQLDYQSERPEVCRLSGGQRLEDWGVRLGCAKADYQGGWEHFNEEMLRYCSQDVKVSVRHAHYLIQQPVSVKALELEQRIHYEYSQMELRGINFDTDKAQELALVLDRHRSEIQEKLDALVPPVRIEGKTPQYWTIHWPDGSQEQFDTKGDAETERKRRKIKPAECTLVRGPNKFTMNRFNPGSPHQVRDYLVREYDWVSPKLTKKGVEHLKAGGDYKQLARQYGSTEEDILRTLNWPEADLFADYGMLSKVYSMVITGKSAWLNQVDADGRIHPRFKGIGARTHRSSAATPNVMQIPGVSVDKETKEVVWGIEGRFGAECRQLFIPTEGYEMVGMDLAGIEACMLAHFLYPFDGGKYVSLIVNDGDIHQLNVDAILKYAGYKVGRGDSKPMYYGKLYGIGAVKQGQVVVDASEDAKSEFLDMEAYYRQNPRKITKFHRVSGAKIPYRPPEMAYATIGAKVNTALVKGIEGMEELDKSVQKASEKGYLSPLDGRRIPTGRHKSSRTGKWELKTSAALNTLLQGSAGIVFKRAVLIVANRIRHMDANLLLPCHDELQAEVRPDLVDAYQEIALEAPRLAGQYYDLKLPITGETKVGTSWLGTH